MPKMKAAKQAELEAFWRELVNGWRRSLLNQREYCEVHGAAAEAVRELACEVQA